MARGRRQPHLRGACEQWLPLPPAARQRRWLHPKGETGAGGMIRLSVFRSARSPHSGSESHRDGHVPAGHAAGGAASQPVQSTPARSYVANSLLLLATPHTPSRPPECATTIAAVDPRRGRGRGGGGPRPRQQRHSCRAIAIWPPCLYSIAGRALFLFRAVHSNISIPVAATAIGSEALNCCS